MNDQTPDSPALEETFFDFKCPDCRQTASFPGSATGKASDCPNCAQVFIVPGPGSEFGRPIPIPIRTERLTLRRLTSSDGADLAEFMSDPELFPYTDGRTMDAEQIEDWVNADARVQLTTPDQTFFLAVVRNDTDRVIGWTGLEIEPKLRREATVTMAIDRRHHKNGFGAEALRAILDFCLQEIQLHRVVTCCDGRNVAAQRTSEKAGMRYEAGFLENRPDGDHWADTVWYGLLERESASRTSPPAAS